MGALFSLLSRLAQAALVLFIVGLLVYTLLDLLPGDAAELQVGPAINLTPEERAAQVEALRESMGLNRPLFVRYFDWLGGVLTGDLGRTLRNVPIGPLLAERFLISAEIVLISVALALTLAILIGLALYRVKAEWVSRMVLATSSVFIIIPSFYLAFILVVVFSVGLGIFPSNGYTSLWDNPGKHYIGIVLPVITLTLPQIAVYLPYLVQGLRESGQAPMAIAAVARGLSQRRLLFGHLLPNGILPTISVAGLNLASLLGGIIIIEFAFGLPGTGSLLLRGINDQDLNLVAVLVLIIAAAYVLMTIVVDVVYTLIDPRLRKVSR